MDTCPVSCKTLKGRKPCDASHILHADHTDEIHMVQASLLQNIFQKSTDIVYRSIIYHLHKPAQIRKKDKPRRLLTHTPENTVLIPSGCDQLILLFIPLSENRK